MRGTSREPEGVRRIQQAGIEAALADPDRPGTILELVDDVTVVCWLLGSATGPAAATAAVNGPRLESLVERLVDTPVRGFAYEAVGSVDDLALSAGRFAVERAAATWRIPVALLQMDRGAPDWADDTAARLLALPGS